MSAAEKIFNPYPGLRSFKSGESNLFFSREKQSNEITAKLLSNRFLALIGPSGSGKSSLLSAGVVPGLPGFNNDPSVSSWHIINSRPGNTPINNLAKDLVNAGIQNDSENTDNNRYEKTAALLRTGSHELKEILRDAKNNINKNTLIIIDQFEELFRQRRNINPRTIKDERKSYIQLVIELQKQEELPVFVLIAVRSDYIQECHKFRELTELINQSNHFLSPMTTEDILEVIRRPAALAGGKTDSGFERQLISDLRDQSDPLPSLQYILMRTWEYWMKQENYDKPLSVKEYEEVGKMDNALSMHADEIYAELSENGQKTCEKIFKTIAQRGTGDRDMANPARIADIASIAGIGVADTIDVIERFRQPGRCFLTPFHDIELNSGTIIDLSHESLIRLWKRLNTWVAEESSSVAIYNRLAEKSRLYQIRKTGLLKNPDLEMALKWREENEPSFDWAKWHNTAFERTMAYLRKSEEEFKKEEAEKFKKPVRSLKKARLIATFLGFVAIVSIGMVLHTSNLYTAATRQSAPAVPDIPPAREQTAINETLSGETDNLATTAADRDNRPVLQNSQNQGINSTNPGQRTSGERSAGEISSRTNSPGSQVPSSERGTSGNPHDNSSEDTAREKEYMKRIRTAGHSLITNSLELEDNASLKALLALQAENFSKEYNENDYYPDLYAGLHSSLKAIFGNTFNVFSGHAGSVNSVVFRPNSSIFYSASSDGKVLQWDLDDDTKTPATLFDINGINNSLAISSNGQWLAVATNGLGIKIFNPTRNNPFPITVNRGSNRFIAMDFHPDNEHLIFADSDNNIIKYNITSGNDHIVATADNEIFSLSVSPDGNKIAAGTRGGQAVIWTGETNWEQQIIHQEEGNDVHAVQFNHNGTRLATGSLRGTLQIWEVVSGDLITSLNGHSARIVNIKFSPDNSKIASTSFDGTIRLWNVQDLSSQPLILSDHGSWVLSVDFDTEGKKLVSGSRQENRLMSWYLETGDMAAMICSEVTRNLTREEWNLYVGEEIPYMETCPL